MNCETNLSVNRRRVDKPTDARHQIMPIRPWYFPRSERGTRSEVMICVKVTIPPPPMPVTVVTNKGTDSMRASTLNTCRYSVLSGPLQNIQECGLPRPAIIID
jgi:hypothetical protein